jgi:sulfur carrier protein ThiS
MEEEQIPIVLDLNGKEITVKGYYVSDIQQYLTNVEFQDFNKFMNGKQVVIMKGKQLIHKEDYEQWKNNKSNIQLS